MCGRLPCVFVLWSGARQPPTPLSLCIDFMVTPIPPSRRRSIRSRRRYRIHRLLLVIHPLPLLVAFVVVLVASRSLVVVAAPPLAGASSDGRGGGQQHGFTPTKQGISGRETQCLWEVMSLLWMRMSLFMDENVTFMDENVSLYESFYG